MQDVITDNSIKPLLKWVGGKRQLLSEIIKRLPYNIKDLTYYEPFIGGGAVFFHLQPTGATINDLNEELINFYQVVRDHPDALIENLKKHKNTATYFYAIRSLDRQPCFATLSNIERASRILYLNKTCYNGLYRVNSAGEFNTPFGNYKNPNITNEATIRAVSQYLNEHAVHISNEDYEQVLKNIPTHSFVYLDPPYYPISQSANFTGYVQGGWNEREQIRLRNVCNELHSRGIKFLLSNSASTFIKEIYANYNIHVVKATRAINSVASKRGHIDELLISNYETE